MRPTSVGLLLSFENISLFVPPSAFLTLLLSFQFFYFFHEIKMYGFLPFNSLLLSPSYPKHYVTNLPPFLERFSRH